MVRAGEMDSEHCCRHSEICLDTRQKLGIRAKGRKAGESYQLREPQVYYPAHLGIENKDIGAEKSYFLVLYQKVSR